MSELNIYTPIDRSVRQRYPKDKAKREVFDWKPLGEKGNFMHINKKELRLDLSYQREAVSVDKVRRLARDFDWQSFGALSVSMRKDGFYVTDGGNRLRACELRDDVTDVPCMVFDAEGVEDEAQAFLNHNVVTNAVKPYDRYRALLVTRDPVAILLKETFEYHNYKPVKDRPGSMQTNAIGTFLETAGKDPAAFKKAFSLTVDIADGGAIVAVVFRGIFYLISKGQTEILERKNRQKLVSLGIEIITQLIQREKHLQSGGVKTEAAVIINIINKGRRTRKLLMPVS